MEPKTPFCPVTQDAIDFDPVGESASGEGLVTEINDLASSEPKKLPTNCLPLTTERFPEHPEPKNGKGEPEQIQLLALPEDWEAAWKNMPSFSQKNLSPWKSIFVHFENRADMESFAKLVDQPIGLNTRSIWHPAADICRMVDKRFVDEDAGSEDIEILDIE